MIISLLVLVADTSFVQLIHLNELLINNCPECYTVHLSLFKLAGL